jgi:hypothetical protein
MPALDYGPWLPDLPKVGGPHLVDAKGCLPAAEAYEPLPSLMATTGALSARCRGGYAARDKDQAAHIYAGDTSKLYELEGATWTDRGKVGGYGPATDNTRWRFTTFGDRLIAINGIDAPQYIDMSTAATAFANLPDSPPAAQFIATYGEFVFLGALSTNGMTIKWSDIGDSGEWTAGTGLSDEQEFADGGRITGLVATQGVLYVLQEDCIRRVLFVGGDLIFQIDKIVDGIGCVEPNSLVSYGQRMFFLDESGWFMFDGVSEPKGIGVEAFDQWFLSDASRTYWPQMSAVIDPKRKLFAVGYASTGSGGGVPDSILFFNYVVGRATYARMDHEILIGAMSAFTSLDDLLGDLDVDYTVSFDDPFYAGGVFYFAAFDTAHKLASFAGSPVEATLETGQVQIFDGRRASVEYIKPVTDSIDATVAGGSAVRAGDAITYQSAVAQQTSGRCPQRGVNGFFMSAKTVIAAASSWTYARSLEWKAKPAGVR